MSRPRPPAPFPAAPQAAAPVAAAPGQIAAVPIGDADKTLAALHDELQRSRDRLVLPGQDRPYFIQYRLLDLDVRTVTAQFGALVSSSTDRNRFMSVNVRVGNYKLDSSNFLSAGGFRGFLGSTGTVGIDRDYNSLRQDLWLATDQAYKEALDSLSKKRAFLRSLAAAPTIDDFSQVAPLVGVQARVEPDWTSRNWDAEAKTVSAALRKYSELVNSKVTYHLIYATNYMISTEGTLIRSTRSLAAIEASSGSEADDGVPLHNFLAIYANRPSELPTADAVRQSLDRVGQQLAELRDAPLVEDYEGPILVEAPAAGSLVAQILGPSLGGARPPLSTSNRFEQSMQALGGRSDWTGRRGQRVLPADVSICRRSHGHAISGPAVDWFLRRGSGRRARRKSFRRRCRCSAPAADVPAARPGFRPLQWPRPFHLPCRCAAPDEQSFLHRQRRRFRRRPAPEIPRCLQEERPALRPGSTRDG